MIVTLFFYVVTNILLLLSCNQIYYDSYNLYFTEIPGNTFNRDIVQNLGCTIVQVDVRDIQQTDLRWQTQDDLRNRSI